MSPFIVCMRFAYEPVDIQADLIFDMFGIAPRFVRIDQFGFALFNMILVVGCFLLALAFLRYRFPAKPTADDELPDHDNVNGTNPF